MCSPDRTVPESCVMAAALSSTPKSDFLSSHKDRAITSELSRDRQPGRGRRILIAFPCLCRTESHCPSAAVAAWAAQTGTSWICLLIPQSHLQAGSLNTILASPGSVVRPMGKMFIFDKQESWQKEGNSKVNIKMLLFSFSSARFSSKLPRKYFLLPPNRF